MMYILPLLILLVAIHITTDTSVTLTTDYTVVTIVPASDEERTSKGLLLACTCIIHYIGRSTQ